MKVLLGDSDHNTSNMTSLPTYLDLSNLVQDTNLPNPPSPSGNSYKSCPPSPVLSPHTPNSLFNLDYYFDWPQSPTPMEEEEKTPICPPHLHLSPIHLSLLTHFSEDFIPKETSLPSPILQKENTSSIQKHPPQNTIF